MAVSAGAPRQGAAPTYSSISLRERLLGFGSI